jgi:hypothetical protein
MEESRDGEEGFRDRVPILRADTWVELIQKGRASRYTACRCPFTWKVTLIHGKWQGLPVAVLIYYGRSECQREHVQRVNRRLGMQETFHNDRQHHAEQAQLRRSGNQRLHFFPLSTSDQT